MADYISDRADITPAQADVAAPDTTATPQNAAGQRPAEPGASARRDVPPADTAEARAFVAKRLTRHNAKAAASAVAAAGALLPALAAAALPGGFTPVSEIAGLASWEVRNGRLILRLANGTVREFAAGEWVAGTEPGEIGLRSDLVAVATGGGQAAGGVGNLGVGAAILGIAAAGGVAAAAGGGGGGGGGGGAAPQPAPTFDVVRSGNTVSFAGTATGDIVATVLNNGATFTRGGISRTVDGLFSNTTMSIAGGQTVVLVVTNANGQQTGAQTGTVSADGAGNLVIRATDAGPGATTNVSLNVDITLTGGTLTLDMTNDNQDVVRLTGRIDLGGGRLVVSDGVANVANVALSGIGSVELNSELIVSLAELRTLAGPAVLSGVGTLTVASTSEPADDQPP